MWFGTCWLIKCSSYEDALPPCSTLHSFSQKLAARTSWKDFRTTTFILSSSSCTAVTKMSRFNGLMPQLGRSPQAPTIPTISPQVTPTEEQFPREARPGYFEDIGDFLTCNDASRELELTWTSGLQESISPQTIIYIKDKPANTRLSDRVMLVLRHSTDTGSSLTCLSFCRHPNRRTERLHKNHRRVNAPQQAQIDGASPRPQGPVINNVGAASTKMRSVELDLYHNRNDALQPQPEITLNCEELWNVERGVKVAVLGEVTAASFKEVVKQVKDLFCEALDQAVRDDESSSHDNQGPAPSAMPAQPVAIEIPHRIRNRDRNTERAEGGRADPHRDHRTSPRRNDAGDRADARRDSHDRETRPRPAPKRYRIERNIWGKERRVLISGG